MLARRVSLLLVITLSSVGIGACSGSHSQPPAALSSPSVSPSARSQQLTDPLRAVDFSNGIYEMPVSKTDRIGNGLVTFENVSAYPLHIVRVQPVYANGSAKLLGTGIVTLSRSDLSDTGPGVTRSFPVAGSQPLDAFTIEPSDGGLNRYALIVGLQLADGGSSTTINGFKLTTQLAGISHTQTLLGTLVLCTGQPRGATKCP